MDLSRVLLIEDNDVERMLLVPYLRASNFRVLEAQTVKSALSHLQSQTFDLVVLDLNLPDGDGLDLLDTIKQCSAPPVIAVTARDGDLDRISGLKAGVADYLCKPFHPEELVLRSQNLLERSQKPRVIQIGFLTLKPASRELFDSEGQPVSITQGEMDLLLALVHARGVVVSRDDLLNAISRKRDEHASDRSVDVLISRLRKKLEVDPKKPQRLVTVVGAGYRLILK